MALLDGLGSALKALDCFVLSQGAYVFGSLNALQGLDQGLASNVINGARRLRGCDPNNDPTPPVDPNTPIGGQCPGVGYAVFFDAFDPNTGAPNPNNPLQLNNMTGPISLVINDDAPVGCPPPSFGLASKTLIGADSTQAAGGAGCVEFEQTRNFVFTRLDGLPDDCGNAPSPPPPAISLNIDVDVEYVDEGDNIVSITVPVEFKPFTVNFNGDVVFPIDFSLGGIDFNGDVTFSPDFSLTINPPRFPKGGGGQEFPEGDPGDERPPAAPEANIVGAIVLAQSVSDNAATSIDFNGGPDIFAPRLGSLKFAYSLGAATFWSPDIDVKGTRTFIPCPFSQGADAIAVSAVPGVTLTATPVRGFPLATIGDIKAVLDVV